MKQTIKLRLSIALVFVLALVVLAGGYHPVSAVTPTVDLVYAGQYLGGGAEISAYDPLSQRLFVTGAGANVEVLDLSDPANPVYESSLLFDATSVAVRGGILAVAVPNPADNTLNGHVYLYDSTSDLSSPFMVEVGALPDMLTFTPDGGRILVANEGEPGAAFDPEGSVSIIDVSRGIHKAVEKKATFKRFNDLRSQLVASGVRIFPTAESVAQDFEPEYIAISADGKTAWVSLQEANALAVLRIPAATFQDILPLGLKNYNLPGAGIDASDRDGRINIANWPVYGMYMPDGIASFQVGNANFIVTANEGDDRGEAARVNSLSLDPTVFPNAATLKQNANLGRLNVSLIDGDSDSDGDYDMLYSYGARSFTIWDAQGQQVFDSGDTLEQITAAMTPTLFNADSGDPAQFDTRSDNKGPEPEGVAIFSRDGSTYAFIGLERAGGGVMVFDVTDPHNASLVQYVRTAGDVGPEGLLVISAADSPNGVALLVVTNEVSQTTTIYEIQ